MSDIMTDSIQSLLERFQALEAQAKEAERLQETMAQLANEMETLKGEIKHLKEEIEDHKDAICYPKNKNDLLEISVAKMSEEQQKTKAHSRLLPPEIKQLEQKLGDTDDVVAEMIPDQWETAQKADEALRLIEGITGDPNSRALGKKRKRDVVQMVNQELLAEESSESDPKKRRVTEDD